MLHRLLKQGRTIELRVVKTRNARKGVRYYSSKWLWATQRIRNEAPITPDKASERASSGVDLEPTIAAIVSPAALVPVPPIGAQRNVKLNYM